MAPRKTTKKTESSASETIIEAQLGDRWTDRLAAKFSAHLPLWVGASLSVCVAAFMLAGWPYLDRILRPEPASPWASDIEQIQTEFGSQIDALERRISQLEANAVTLEELARTSQTGQTALTDEVAQIALLLAALDDKIEGLVNQPAQKIVPDTIGASDMVSGEQERAEASGDMAEMPDDSRPATAQAPQQDDQPSQDTILSQIADFFSNAADGLRHGFNKLGGLFSSVITVSPIQPENGVKK